MEKAQDDTREIHLQLSALKEENARLKTSQVEQQRVLNSLEVVNPIIIEATDLDVMLGQVLQEFLNFFSCDRAWLLYPCDPDAATYRVPMEQTRLQWPGAESKGLDIPTDKLAKQVFASALATSNAVRYDPEEHPLNPDDAVNTTYSIRSQLTIAIHPKIGKPWLLGIHHCTAPVIYSQNDCDLFKTLGNRLADGLSSLLSWQNAKRLFEDAEVALLNEDLSEIRKALNRLRLDGVVDLRRYLIENEQFARDLAAKVKVLQVNKATLKLFGAKSEEEFICQRGKIFGVSAIEAFMDELCAIWNKQKYFRSEVDLRSLDGRDLTAIVSFQTPETEDAFRSVPICITDITERKLAEEQRDELETQLRQKHKIEAIGTLAGGIAHDFNNLLAIIRGNLEIIQCKQKKGSRFDKNLEFINQSTSRAIDLVKQILAFSRQEKTQLTPLDLPIVIEGSLRLLGSTIPSTVKIVSTCVNETVLVNADATQLQQICINLGTNAVHAMQSKGVLTVTLDVIELSTDEIPATTNRQAGRYAKLTVTDTGTGMDNETIARIFEPFFTTKSVGEGTGMGLSVVYGIVDSHGGFITVESTLGQGTSFNIYFPTIDERRQKPEDTATQELPFGTERILFVDDEKDVSSTYTELLEYQGYNVTSTTNSVEALAIFKDNPERFDLVFTDQAMPEMTGTELAAELLKFRPDIPIILCSGFDTITSEIDTKSIGIRKFCTKPLNKSQLALIVRKVLDDDRHLS